MCPRGRKKPQNPDCSDDSDSTDGSPSPTDHAIREAEWWAWEYEKDVRVFRMQLRAVAWVAMVFYLLQLLGSGVRGYVAWRDDLGLGV